MASSKGRTHGRTTCWAPTAPSSQARTSPTTGRPRTRSAATSTSLPSASTEPLEASAASASTTDSSSLSPLIHRPTTTPSSSTTSTPRTSTSSRRCSTRAAVSPAPPKLVLQNPISSKTGKDSIGKDDAPMYEIEAAGKTYNYRACNTGLKTSLNFRIQAHFMKLAEIDGSHTVQNIYESIDVHAGQCYSLLVTADQTPVNYYMVISTCFLKTELTSTAVIGYTGSNTPPSPALPPTPVGWAWSLNQWRSFQWNLTASAARPNPRGSYHYGSINITRTIILDISSGLVDGKRRYALNGVSHVDVAVPLNLAEYFGITDKVFKYNLIDDVPLAADAPIIVTPNVITAEFRTFIEIIFENPEKSIMSYHLDGYSFSTGMGPGKWTPESRKGYNLLDTVTRHTIQVYPKLWMVITLTFDNAGM